MKYNRLGQTGLFVSEICLGTMTFSGDNYFGGAIGTLGQKDATALIARALEARDQFHRHRQCLFLRRVRKDDRPGAEGSGRQAQRCGAGDQGVRPHGRPAPTTWAPPAAISWTASAAAWSGCRPIISTFTRSIIPTRMHRRGRDHAGAGRSGAPGHGALCRRLQLGSLEDRQGQRRRRQARLDPDRNHTRSITPSPAATWNRTSCR